MGGENVLADQVIVGRPPAGELGIVGGVADGGDVVGQGVEPNVSNVIAVEGYLDAPCQARFGP